MLVPVVLLLGVIVRLRSGDASQSGITAPVPWFLIVFMGLFVANSVGVIPRAIALPLADSASLFLLLAIAALGVRTSLKEVLTIGIKPVMLLVGETVFLASAVLAYLMWLA